MKQIKTYRIFKANGEWLYDTTSLTVAEAHRVNGYTFALLPDGFWVRK
jgi:hypothetical protein